MFSEESNTLICQLVGLNYREYCYYYYLNICNTRSKVPSSESTGLQKVNEQKEQDLHYL